MNRREAPAIDRLAVSRALSLAASAGVAQILSTPEATATGRTRIIGITGAPGAGKSTLMRRFGIRRLQQAGSLAVIAIDPSSPLSHGAVLGDRIRMGALSDDPRVFIRSLPSRSAEDGLTDNLAEVVAVLDGFGFDEVLLETVGVGQSSYGVRTLADVELLLLTPGAGDYVQAMKAGIMETADIFVVNKADLPGAERLVAELMGVLQHSRGNKVPPIIRVKVDDDAGLVELSETLDRHLATTKRADALEVGRGRRRYRVQRLIQRRLQEWLEAQTTATWDAPLREIYQRVLDELSAEVRQVR